MKGYKLPHSRLDYKNAPFDEFIRLYKSGLTLEKIGQKTGFGWSFIHKHIQHRTRMRNQSETRWPLKSRKEQSLRFKGQRHSPATEFKKGVPSGRKGQPILSIRGANHPQWKGGATEKNKKIRTSLEYKVWRRAVFERDDYTCVWCGVRGAYIEADHIKPFAFFPELRFNLDNGRTLCRPCHIKTDTYAQARNKQGQFAGMKIMIGNYLDLE